MPPVNKEGLLYMYTYVYTYVYLYISIYLEYLFSFIVTYKEKHHGQVSVAF